MSLRGIQILKVIYTSYLGQVFEGLTKKIQSFQRFQNSRRFRVFVLSYRAKTKRRTTENLEISFQWEINEWGAIFMGLNPLFRNKISKMFYMDKGFFSRKQ